MSKILNICLINRNITVKKDYKANQKNTFLKNLKK